MDSLGGEKEKDLHKRLVKLLKERQDHYDFLFFHVKNDVGASRGQRFYDPRPLGVLAGVADFCILNTRGVYFLEIKTLKGRLSDEQKRFLVEVNLLGHCGLVAFGWSDILGKVENILFSNNPNTQRDRATKHRRNPGTVIWVDNKGRYLKRRPKVGSSVFLY